MPYLLSRATAVLSTVIPWQVLSFDMCLEGCVCVCHSLQSFERLLVVGMNNHNHPESALLQCLSYTLATRVGLQQASH
jgi:hypothetical protein